jgi:hypothetical protein
VFGRRPTVCDVYVVCAVLRDFFRHDNYRQRGLAVYLQRSMHAVNVSWRMSGIYVSRSIPGKC